MADEDKTEKKVADEAKAEEKVANADKSEDPAASENNAEEVLVKESKVKEILAPVKKFVMQSPSTASLIVAGIVTCAAISVLSIIWLRPKFEEMQKYFEKRKDLISVECVRRGFAKAEIGLHDQAFKYMQQALVSARTQEYKASAGLGMAEYLFSRAKIKVHPYSLMAKQYVVAVLDFEKRPEERLKANILLMRIASLRGELDVVQAALAEAAQLSPDGAIKATLLLPRLDNFLELGAANDALELLADAGALRDDVNWKYEFKFREAVIYEQMFLEDSLLQKWAKNEYGSVENIDMVLKREEFKEMAISLFDELQEFGNERLISESRFRLARIYFKSGEYDKAEKAFWAFLENEPSTHHRETLLMMTKIARVNGKTRKAGEMISTFLERFSWDSVASEEFIAIIDQAVEEGLEDAAFKLVARYLYMPEAKEEKSRLLVKAATLAESLELYNKSIKYYETLLYTKPTDDFAALAMLKLANLALIKEDIPKAREWLAKYLSYYPYDDRHGESLFLMLDICLKSDVGSSDVINTAVAAASETPGDKRTLATLMLVAEKLEEIGLPALAQLQYNKIALLYYVRADKENTLSEMQDGSIIALAMMGNARCLLEIGEVDKADRLLRELCNNLEEGSLRSEAGYLWASIALNADQKTEAKRRLDIVNLENASPEIAARTVFEQMLLEIEIGESWPTSLALLLAKLENVPPKEHAVFVRKAYLTCFNRLYESSDLVAMKRFFKNMVMSPHAALLPLEELSLRMGNMILSQEGVDEFVASMKESTDLMDSVGIKLLEDMSELVAFSIDIKRQSDVVSEYCKDGLKKK